MKLNFINLSITNFKRFSGCHNIDLADFDIGLHFFKGQNVLNPRLGSNGVGKSTLFDALCWCLYGKTPRGLKNPQIKPWFGEKNTEVILTLYIDDVEYDIIRTANPNMLAVNNEECGQEYVDDLVGLNFDLFTNTILLGQARPLFFDLTAKNKMSLLSDVLELDRWDDRVSYASSQVAGLSSEKLTLETKHDGLESSITALRNDIADLKSKSDGWEQDRQIKLNSYKDKIKKLDIHVDKLSKKVAGLEVAYDINLTEAKHYRSKISSSQKDLRDVQREFDKANVKRSLQKKEVRSLLTELDEFDAKAVCPTCGQEIKVGQSKKHKIELQKKIKRLRLIIKRGVKQELKDDLELHNNHVDNYTNFFDQFTNKANNQRDKLDQWKAKLSQLKAELKSLQDQVEEWETQDNPYVYQLRKLKKELTQKITNKKSHSKNIRLLSRKLERTKFWIKGFKDIKLYLIEELLNELEITTNLMLTQFGLERWVIAYDVEKETKAGTIQRGLNVTILSPSNTEPVSWECWSGGEGQRLRIIGALALSEVLLNHASVQTDLEILDEPTQHVSEEGIDDLCDLLANRAMQIDRSIFYVDHQSVESTKFASVVTVVNDEDGSKLVMN